MDVVLGSKRVFAQYLALLLAAMAMISVMLFGFAPVTLFFRLSIDDYWFFLLLNIVILGFTGVVGVKFFFIDRCLIEFLKNHQKTSLVIVTN